MMQQLIFNLSQFFMKALLLDNATLQNQTENGGSTGTASTTTATTPETFDGDLAFVNNILDFLQMILTPILVVVATAGTIYAVILGVNMARAETADKREEAKKRIINAVVALGITIVLILLLNLFKENITEWIG